MDSLTVISLSGLILGTGYLSISYKSAFVFDIPYILFSVGLALGGIVAIFAANAPALLHLIKQLPEYRDTLETAEAANGTGDLRDNARPINKPRSASIAFAGAGAATYGRQHRIKLFATLVVAITVRLQFARWVITHMECASWNAAYTLPLQLAAAEYFSGMTHFGTSKAAYSVVAKRIFERWRIFFPAALLTLGGYIYTQSRPYLRSTYICPLASAYHFTIPLMQFFGTSLDAVIAVIVNLLLFDGHDIPVQMQLDRLMTLGVALLASSLTFCLSGLALTKVLSISAVFNQELTPLYLTSLLKIGSAAVIVLLSAVHLTRRIGLRGSCSCAFVVSIFSLAMNEAARARTHFLPTAPGTTALALIVSTGGLWAFVYFQATHFGRSDHNSLKHLAIPRIVVFIVFFAFIVQCLLWPSSAGLRFRNHPIDQLMAAAEERHDEWLAKASASKGLIEAAENYRKRYRRKPPPRFDVWYQFAKERNSLIIDDFDQIYEDLLPWWAFPPFEIRWRTFESISNPWNMIGGILVRGGNLTVTQNLPDTHRWMMYGVADMMEPFVKHLPDMDLAFNLNDEPRTALTYAFMQVHRAFGRRINYLPPREGGDFGSDRSKGWRPIPAEPWELTRYREASFKNSFYSYGTVGCPPDSMALHQRPWSTREMCASCAAPHLHEQFVANWTYAADPCHQPDLRDNHGFYLSPSLFRNSRELMPVFSQSKTHGYADILYPSAWNYVERFNISYRPNEEEPDPEWQEKEATLFWRGATSEGKSVGNGAWQGMSRQRAVHLFNNGTSSDKALVLLPEKPLPKVPNPSSHSYAHSHDQTFRYRYFHPSTLAARFSTSLQLVTDVARCAFRDCDMQYAEFHPELHLPFPFQRHWRFKYLLDLDGAGFSGRFLPFLKSKSLPFKASLMREWWDGRVQAWVHFVPVDIRLSEIWSLLTYFAGWRDGSPGNEQAGWLMAPREREAQKIADAGKAWAERTLRKEDMEVYLFRLLLEWGRVTDDRRDELGWYGDDG